MSLQDTAELKTSSGVTIVNDLEQRLNRQVEQS